MSAPVDPPAPEATPEPAANLGPWAADLAEYFGDNQEAIAAADRYMREKVQPGRTQFEQEVAPARELYKDLLEDPQGTLAAVIGHFYDEEVAEKFAGLFEDPEHDPVPPPTPTAESRLTAEEQEAIAWATEQRDTQRDQKLRDDAAAAYEARKAELRGAHDDLTDADMELIDPFFAIHDELEDVYDHFTRWKGAFGGQPAPTPEPTPAAPAVLGTAPGGAPAAVPPVEKKYTDIGEALDDYFAEQRQQAPPVVGSA